jgi:hypothetical protein
VTQVRRASLSTILAVMSLLGFAYAGLVDAHLGASDPVYEQWQTAFAWAELAFVAAAIAFVASEVLWLRLGWVAVTTGQRALAAAAFAAAALTIAGPIAFFGMIKVYS